MDKLILTNLLPPLLAALAASILLGIILAYMRAQRIAAGWIVFDVLVLLPAFLPATLLTDLLGGVFGGPTSPVADYLPALATTIVSLPFAYLPARLAFGRIAATYRDSSLLLGLGAMRKVGLALPLAGSTLAISALLATARVFSEFAPEVFAYGLVLVIVAIPTLVAAALIARSAIRPAPEV